MKNDLLNRLDIKYKLFLMAILCGLIPMFILGAFAINHSSREITSEIYQSNALYTTLTRETIENYFTAREGDALLLANSKSISQGVEQLNTFDSNVDTVQIESEFKAFTDIAINKYGYTDIFITNSYKEVIFSSNYNKLDIAPLASSGDYIDKGMSGTQNWSGVFRNSFINDNIMILTTPIYANPLDAAAQLDEDHKPIGTVNLVLNQDAINQLVQKGIQVIGDSGHAFIVDANGQSMNDTDFQIHNAAFLEAIQTNTLDYKKTTTYTNHVSEEVIGTQSILKFGDQPVGFVIEVTSKEALSGLTSLRNQLIFIILLIMLLSILITLLLSNNISKPILAMVDLTDAISNFEFKSFLAIRKHTRKDEIGRLQLALGRIVANFEQMIQSMDAASTEASQASALLVEGIQNSTQASDALFAQIHHISGGSGKQAESALSCFEATSDLSHILSENHQALFTMKDTTQAVMYHIESGLNIMDELSAIHQISNQNNKEVKKRIDLSIEHSNSIESTSQMIQDIAKKTNLLALNASIEAARAGEFGRGFSVVAEEIKALSTQSKESAEKINQMVYDLKTHNAQIVQVVDILLQFSQDQMLKVNETQVNYRDIHAAIQDVKAEIEKIEFSNQMIENKRITVHNMVHMLSEISIENSHHTEMATLSIHEQSKIMKGLSASSDDLKQQSNALIDLIQVYTKTETITDAITETITDTITAY